MFGEKRLVKSVKLLPLSIRSIKATQKYPHIIDSFACILKIFVFMFLFPIRFMISFGMCLTPKLSK